VEADEAAILASLHGQARGIARFSDRARRAMARMNWLHGQWLRMEAERLGLPVVDARPWDTLVDRLLSASA